MPVGVELGDDLKKVVARPGGQTLTKVKVMFEVNFTYTIIYIESSSITFLNEFAKFQIFIRSDGHFHTAQVTEDT